MFVETLHKAFLSKSLTFLLVMIGGFIREYRKEEPDDAPGDNFPQAVMFR